MNKTLKKTLSIILTILMIVTSVPFAFATDCVHDYSGEHTCLGYYCGACDSYYGEPGPHWWISDQCMVCLETHEHRGDAGTICMGTLCEICYYPYGEVTDPDAHRWNKDGTCGYCDAKCEHPSYTDGLCSVCGYICVHENYTDGKCDNCGTECNHSFTSYVAIEAPTCTETGLEIAVCSKGCGATDEKEISALEHIPLEAVKENKVEPKCGVAGSYDLVVYCDLCNDVLERETVPVAALEHKDDDGDNKCDYNCGYAFAAESDGVKTTLDVSKGNIVIADSYVTLGNETVVVDPDGYIVTGTARGDTPLKFINNSEESKTFDLVFNNLSLTANTWNSVIAIEDNSPVTLNIVCEGSNAISSDNHPVFNNTKAQTSITINITITEGSSFTFERRSYPENGILFSNDDTNTFVYINGNQLDAAAQCYTHKNIDGIQDCRGYLCDNCGQYFGEALEHKDDDGDYNCDYNCSYVFEHNCGQILILDGDIKTPVTCSACDSTIYESDGRWAEDIYEAVFEGMVAKFKGYGESDTDEIVAYYVVKPSAGEDCKLSFDWAINQGYIEYGSFKLHLYHNDNEVITRDFTQSANPYDSVLSEKYLYTADGEYQVFKFVFEKTGRGRWYDGGRRAFLSNIKNEIATECDKTGHDIVVDEYVAPTCTETGLTEGSHCTRCDDMTVAQEVIPATNHKDTLVQVEAKAKTCTEIGWDAYEYCTECEYTTYVEIPALEHKDDDGDGFCDYDCASELAVIEGETYVVLGDITYTGLNYYITDTPGCYKAGDGYAVIKPADAGTELILYNATIDVREEAVSGDSSEDDAVCVYGDLNVTFIGTNNIYAKEGYNAFNSVASSSEDTPQLVINGAEGAVLNLYGRLLGYYITVKSGTVNAYVDDPDTEVAISAQKYFTVEKDAVVTAVGADNELFPNIGVISQHDMTIIEGVLNAFTFELNAEEFSVALKVFGDVTAQQDIDVSLAAQEVASIDLVISEGSSLTIPEGCTINLDSFNNVEIKGKLIVNGTLICTHKGGTATCTEKAVCDVCGREYGEVLGHTPLEAVKENEVAPKCGVAGSYDLVVYCDVCDEELDRDTVAVDALTHTDADGDYLCDNGCGHEFEKPVDPTPDEPAEDTCDRCGEVHTNFFQNFICMIRDFFNRIISFFTGLFK